MSDPAVSALMSDMEGRFKYSDMYDSAREGFADRVKAVWSGKM